MQRGFLGTENTVIAFGFVEDIFDPLYLGRVKVRWLGWHTPDKEAMPTETLPWATPILPIDSGQNSIGLKLGDQVCGFFADGKLHQKPYILGTINSIPEEPANPEMGFNDPTPDEELSADLLPRTPDVGFRQADEEDGEESEEEVQTGKDPNVLPTNGTASGEFQSKYDPANYKFDMNKDGVYDSQDAELLSFDANFDGVIDKSEDEFIGGTQAEHPMTRYPLEHMLKEPDLTNRYARGKEGEGKIEETVVAEKKSSIQSAEAASHISSGVGTDVPAMAEPFNEPPTPYDAKYPFNHTYLSESGHLHETDDTPGKERLHTYHRAGSFTEIHPDGTWVWRCVKSMYKFAMEHIFAAATQSMNLTAGAEMRILGKSMNITTKEGDMNFTVGEGGNLNFYVQDGNVNGKIVGKTGIVFEENVRLHFKQDLYLIVDGLLQTVVAKDQVEHIKGHHISTVDISKSTQVAGKNEISADTFTVDSPISTFNGIIGATLPALLIPTFTPAPPVPFSPPVVPPDPDLAEDPAEGASVSEPKPGYVWDGPDNDLWKPVGDTQPNAVSLGYSPQAHEMYEAIPTGELENVTIEYKNADGSITSWDVVRPVHRRGKLIEVAKSKGIMEGRYVWRWSKPGADYPTQVIINTGTADWLTIDSAERHD